ncbi:CUB and sushi domain-containing protein 1-like isoform X3 [Erpetoichthys calabaricus]|uniref:CUB and sushi domain-containing protein 1-like isoform X3 n=1 Tax=Erpetoichthys calabaricus TaxID=27687 RepID=UPI0022345E59|nr:CUB and sushi domain-containing protein 1-like isoform X3 [Erpetoichthys calabaricus]
MDRQSKRRATGGPIIELLLLGISLTAQVTGECMSFETDPNVMLTAEHLTVNEFPDGYNATFKCSSGYRPTNDLVTITCVDSKWTKLKLICEPIICNPPENMMNGKFDTSKTVHFGQKIYAECSKGYVMVGRNYRMCLANGKWDGRNPTCEPDSTVYSTTMENNNFIRNEEADVADSMMYSTTMENNNFIRNEEADVAEHVYSPGFDSLLIVGVTVLGVVTICIFILYIRKKNKKGSYYLPTEEQHFVNGSNGNSDEKVLTPQEKLSV